MPLVLAQRVVVAAAAVPGGVERAGAQLGVAEGVGDALGGDRVLGVAGVPDQRPARPVRCPEPVRHSFAHDPGFLPPAVEPAAEGSGDLAQVVALQVLFHLGRLGLRPGGEDQRQVVVGGDQAESAAGPDHPPRPGGGHAGPVRVVGTGQHRALAVTRRVHLLGDPRVHPVGADDHAGVLADLQAAAGVPADAGDPVAVGDQLGRR